MVCHNPNLDLVSTKAHAQIFQSSSICFHDVERKRNADVKQEP